jgi:hypothetical protein
VPPPVRVSARRIGRELGECGLGQFRQACADRRGQARSEADVGGFGGEDDQPLGRAVQLFGEPEG